jgi:hypothetical protein
MAKYLVCDPPPAGEEVFYYTLVGLPNNPEAPRDETGEYGFKYDLSYLEPGVYSLMVSACNEWKCSLAVPFEFSVPASPSSPSGLRLV